MLTEKEQTDAYATLHAALRGWADGTLDFEEFAEAIHKLRTDLDEKLLKNGGGLDTFSEDKSGEGFGKSI